MKKLGIIILSFFIICFIASTIFCISFFKKSPVNDSLKENFNEISDQVANAFTTEKNFNSTTKKEDTTKAKETTVSTIKETVETTANEVILLQSYIGKPLSKFIEKANELNYSATYLADGVDFTSFIEAMQDSYITGELKINPENKTVIVNLVLASNIEISEKTDELKEKLQLGSSWIAVENYGKSIYGNSFELHYMLDKIAEEYEDENTWFLKARCTIDGVKKTCEAKVTGTTNNPEVFDFLVY